MTKISFSKRAISDLTEIADYTLENWGLAQSRKYKDGLNEMFQVLLKDKKLGKLVSGSYSSKSRCFPFEAHIIYYLPSASGILIVRILDQRMDSKRHLK